MDITVLSVGPAYAKLVKLEAACNGFKRSLVTFVLMMRGS